MKYKSIVFFLFLCLGLKLLESPSLAKVRKGWFGEMLPYQIETLEGEWSRGPFPHRPRPGEEIQAYKPSDKMYRCTTDGSMMVYVPAGEFRQGSLRARSDDCKSERMVYLNGYYIDRHEITNMQYMRFAQSHYMAERYWSPEGLFWFRNPATQMRIVRTLSPKEKLETDKPSTRMNWYEAEAYANAVGKMLPTEAQWEKAARGTDGRIYPWGDTKDFSTRCNWKTVSDTKRPSTIDMGEVLEIQKRLGRTQKDLRIKDYQSNNFTSLQKGSSKTLDRQIKEDKSLQEHLTPVGSFPDGASPYGCLDMAGNVWEWVRDAYEKNYYSKAPERNPFNDKRDVRVNRGGSWSFPEEFLATYARLPRSPEKRSKDVGFRTIIPAPIPFSDKE
jgi:sulfatase modifying factor 1